MRVPISGPVFVWDLESRRGGSRGGFALRGSLPMVDGEGAGEEREEREVRVVRCSDGRLRKCKARRTGWTAGKRRIFLDHLAATSNATASARKAGMGVRSAFALRARDPQFAAEWDAALRQAEARLKGKLVVYAETQGKKAAREGDEENDASDVDGFDPDLALRALADSRQSRAGRRRPGNGKFRTATEEETDAELMRLLKALDRRRGRKS